MFLFHLNIYNYNRKKICAFAECKIKPPDMKTKFFFIILFLVLILTAQTAQGIQNHSQIRPWFTNYMWIIIPSGTPWHVVSMLNNNSFLDSLGIDSQTSKYFIHSYLIEKDEFQSVENWMMHSELFRNMQNTVQFDESEEENKIELEAWMNNNQSWLKPDKCLNSGTSVYQTR